MRSFQFLTPWAGVVVAAAVVLPLAALALAERRLGLARRLLHLPDPGAAGRGATIAALVAIPVLLGLAAAQPVIRRDHGRTERTDAQALFVLDISRSMAAAPRPGAPNRLARARAAALDIRSAISDVPSGVATLTDRALPKLFPVGDQAAFDSTVSTTEIEQPPPEAVSSTATTFGPLAGVARDGYFAPGTKRRVIVLLTDGESRPFSAGAVGRALGSTSLVVVRVGDQGERVYHADGTPEAYRPDPSAAATVARLASATGGRVATPPSAGSAVRAALGSGPTAARGRERSITALAPWLAGLAAVPLLFLLVRRRPKVQIAFQTSSN
jgi:Ca-activated chloride channel homolog